MYMLPLGVSAPFGPEPIPSAVWGLGGDLAGGDFFDLNFLGTKTADSAGLRGFDMLTNVVSQVHASGRV